MDSVLLFGGHSRGGAGADVVSPACMGDLSAEGDLFLHHPFLVTVPGAQLQTEAGLQPAHLGAQPAPPIAAKQGLLSQLCSVAPVQPVLKCRLRTE